MPEAASKVPSKEIDTQELDDMLEAFQDDDGFEDEFEDDIMQVIQWRGCSI